MTDPAAIARAEREARGLLAAKYEAATDFTMSYLREAPFEDLNDNTQIALRAITKALLNAASGGSGAR